MRDLGILAMLAIAIAIFLFFGVVYHIIEHLTRDMRRAKKRD